LRRSTPGGFTVAALAVSTLVLGTTISVAGTGNDAISIVDLKANKVVAQLPASCASTNDPCRDTGTSPSCELRSANLDRCSVSSIVAGIRWVVPAEAGFGAKGSKIAIASDGQRAFVIGPRPGQLSVYNVTTGELLDGSALDIPVVAALAN
jgi:hypothetical protein